tara:strand:- start:91 stop:669 length:579 start_codon:yes stop_codon:yes gene_type:complete
MAITILNNRAINRTDTASAGQVFTATSATAADFQAAGGGKIGQVLQAVKLDTQATTANNAWSDVSGLSIAITPAATSSKILVLFNVNISPNTDNHAGIKVVRASTSIFIGNLGSGTRDCFSAIRNDTHAQFGLTNMAGQFLDSPSSTSAVTYKIQGNGNADYYINRALDDGGTTTIQRPRGASSITVMEVLA